MNMTSYAWIESFQRRRTMTQQLTTDITVPEAFDAAAESERRITFLADYLKASGARAYVLGISGGVDSLTSGLLAQAAVERLREQGHAAQFLAMRLPYGLQAEETDARKSLATIAPDRVMTLDIKPAADAMMAELVHGAGDLIGPARASCSGRTGAGCRRRRRRIW